MDCKEFHLKINDFIDNKLDDEVQLENFVEHARECSDCFDELEIYYTIKTGIDEDASGKIYSYDFKKRLEQIISDYESDFYTNYKVRLLSRTLFLVAEIVLVLTVISLIFMYLF